MTNEKRGLPQRHVAAARRRVLGVLVPLAVLGPVLSGCGLPGVAFHAEFVQPPALPRQADADLRTSGAATLHLVDRAGVCGPAKRDLAAGPAGYTPATAAEARAYVVYLPTDSGDVAYQLRVAVTGYRGPGTYTGREVTVLLHEGDEQGLLAVAAGGAPPSGQRVWLGNADAHVTVDGDTEGGTLDARLAAPTSDGGVLHLRGSFRCVAP
jgi:hypothetical protein